MKQSVRDRESKKEQEVKLSFSCIEVNGFVKKKFE